MFIGIADYDLMQKKEDDIPNLEVMKISSYHKRKKDIVEYVKKLNDCEHYNKVYVRKDFSMGGHPTALIKKKNFIIGGLAYTKGIYKPLEDEIEQSPPDITIYDKCGKALTDTFKKRLRKNLVRVETLQDTSRIEDKPTLIYDKNPLCRNIFYDVCKVSRSIEFAYPIHMTDFETAVTLAQLPKVLHSNSIIYEGPIIPVSMLQECAYKDGANLYMRYMFAENTTEQQMMQRLSGDLIGMMNAFRQGKYIFCTNEAHYMFDLVVNALLCGNPIDEHTEAYKKLCQLKQLNPYFIGTLLRMVHK